MKKIILFSCLFGLITNAAFATYYKTTTEFCGDANMRSELDSAVATHRAVITEITCDYVKPTASAKRATPKPMPRKVAAKKYVHQQYRAPKPQPIVVEYEPEITVVQITTTETCTCFDCGC